jgi:hypothetical protein
VTASARCAIRQMAMLPDFYSGATGHSGCFGEGFSLRCSHRANTLRIRRIIGERARFGLVARDKDSCRASLYAHTRQDLLFDRFQPEERMLQETKVDAYFDEVSMLGIRFFCPSRLF